MVDITSNKYDIDKTKDYIIVGSDDDDTILGNITIENGTATIEEDYLVVKNGDNEAKRFKLIKLSSSVYYLSNNYIYVGATIADDIINNIETNAEISINDNILNIYSDYYKINEEYISAGLSDIDLSKITTSNNLELSIIGNTVILTYKDNIIDEIPYYYFVSDSDSDYIRFSSKENKIYVTNKMMICRIFLHSITFGSNNDLIVKMIIELQMKLMNIYT